MTNITIEQITASIANLRAHYENKDNWFYDEDLEEMVYDEPSELILDVNKAIGFVEYSDDLLSLDIWEDETFFEYIEFLDDDQKMEAFVKDLIFTWTSFYEEIEQEKQEREEMLEIERQQMQENN